jgi:hypothetical protein
MMIPGPLTFQNLPNRKITPLSYSRKTLNMLKASRASNTNKVIRISIKVLPLKFGLSTDDNNI